MEKCLSKAPLAPWREGAFRSVAILSSTSYLLNCCSGLKSLQVCLHFPVALFVQIVIILEYKNTQYLNSETAFVYFPGIYFFNLTTVKFRK